ncbi:MAG: glutathione ABC transporter permease GsiC, partial [Calothrix sp. SM1_5_4]|nr:glutathione ABC transporter permease GsiC [Calothrix sp. SM1_5_4]
MLRYVARRLALSALSLAGVVTFSFLLIHLVPGDPVDMILGEQASAQDKETLRRELGLDRPLSRQFAEYVGNLARLDLGL